jgi:hypothetical protein
LDSALGRGRGAHLQSRADAGWADVAGYRGRVNLEKPNGEWNQFIVVADGDRISFNGVKVNEAFNVIPSRGKIQLQSEQAEYFMRRWELQPLVTTRRIH